MKFQETAVGKFFRNNSYLCYIVSFDKDFKIILVDIDEEKISYEYMLFEELVDDFEMCTKEEFVGFYNSLIDSFDEKLNLA